jgi:hypothetical protein
VGSHKVPAYERGAHVVRTTTTSKVAVAVSTDPLHPADIAERTMTPSKITHLSAEIT